MTEKRLIEIETKLAYQEDLIQQLNQIVAGLQQQLDQLQQTNRMLNQRLHDLSESIESVPDQHEKPPHY